MGPFKYLEPETIQQALSWLKKYGAKAKILAAGTDLVPLMKEKSIRPEYIININQRLDLNYIRRENGKGIRIGASTTIGEIEKSDQIQPEYGLICQAAHQLASVSIRNIATIGGNLVNAAPSAEMAPALIALAAKVKLVRKGGEKAVLLEDFFTGPGTTILRADELLTEIQVPLPPAHSGGVYLKYSKRGGEDLALVGVAALITRGEEDGICLDAKLVLGAVAPTPIRALQAENILKGEKVDDRLIMRAAQVASGESSPIDDIYGSSQYKREMIKVFARDALKQAVELSKSAI